MSGLPLAETGHEVAGGLPADLAGGTEQHGMEPGGLAQGHACPGNCMYTYHFGHYMAYQY